SRTAWLRPVLTTDHRRPRQTIWSRSTAREQAVSTLADTLPSHSRVVLALGDKRRRMRPSWPARSSAARLPTASRRHSCRNSFYPLVTEPTADGIRAALSLADT